MCPNHEPSDNGLLARMHTNFPPFLIENKKPKKKKKQKKNPNRGEKEEEAETEGGSIVCCVCIQERGAYERIATKVF